MWRYDAGRTAASRDGIGDILHLHWTRESTPRVPVWDDPLNHDLMPYDRAFEPIVMDGRMFVGFNDRDKLTAFDTKNGQPIWSFFTGGPVRLPPVGWEGRVYFCSDDGFLYCVEAATGKLCWRFQGAPSERKAIGNRRIISAWPARGGPVVRDGHLYFAASIWPFMGTFIYALDADTGEVAWVNDSTGSQYIQQPHSTPSFAGVAPQGALVATEESLLVPGGRSVPAVFHRRTGEFSYFQINAGGKGSGGSFLAANESHFFVHTRQRGVRAFDLEDGLKTALLINEPVLSDDTVYTSGVPTDKEPVVRAYNTSDEVIWKLEVDARGDLIRAGNRLYAAGRDRLTAIQLPTDSSPAKIVWSLPMDGEVVRLLAADNRLFAVTLDGRIMAFGAERRAATKTTEIRRPVAAKVEPTRRATTLLDAGDAEGYAIWYGPDDETLLSEVASCSPFVELAVVEPNASRVERLRRRFDDEGIYGEVTVHHGSPRQYQAPPYVANMIFVGRALSLKVAAASDVAGRLYESVRPYGGVLQLLAKPEDVPKMAGSIAAMELERAEVTTTSEGVLIRRVGQLPGAADWTHQHGDIANTVKSNDSRVKLPLGVLWFGGNSNTDVLPRHGHGPPEQVVGGRLFIQGIDSLSARDVYTGRDLWKRSFEDLGTFDVYYDTTYKETPLDPAYNQVHIPGANARGANYVATSDRLYVIEGVVCHVLDPASGETLHDIRMPPDNPALPEPWAFIGVYEDVLIGGSGFANYRYRHRLSFESDRKLRSSRAGYGSKSYDRSASAGLVGFDRHTGDVLWKITAKHSFWHNGIVAGGGRIYCLDKNPKPIEEALRRRGESAPDSYRIAAFDVKSGEQLWEVSDRVFGTWLGYSRQFDLLLQAGAAGNDRLTAEVGTGMAVHRADDGSLKWSDYELKYSGPCILHNETILTNTPSRKSSAGAFSLLDGSRKMTEHPLTGLPRQWTVSRAYGCNYVIASENLLTFRSGAAGFYDLLTDSGTGNLGGFKSGCTSNLVVADGVLNAPDYTKSCSCAYQNQTSLALVHMPDIELWTVNHKLQQQTSEHQIRQMGVNFGAPGDRRAKNGIMWLEYPELSGEAANLRIEVFGNPKYFRRHASVLPDTDMAWVHASGIENAKTIRIPVCPESTGANESTYRVRLFFGDPLGKPDERKFDVSIQGREVLTQFDMAAETGSQSRATIKQFDNVLISDHLEISFAGDSPILSGVELQRID
jgi:outer membrane protein assembly factor BamB